MAVRIDFSLSPNRVTVSGDYTYQGWCGGQQVPTDEARWAISRIEDVGGAGTARTNLGLAIGTDVLAESDTSIGEQSLFLPAVAMVARTTSGAATGTAETTTNKVMLETFDFDAASDEFVQFAIQMPKSWDAGTVTFNVVWSHSATATNFGVAFALQGLALDDGDAGDTAFGTAVVVTDTGGTTDDLYTSGTSAAVTLAGTASKSDYVVFQLYRDVSDAGDTLAVDARIHGVMVNFTTDAGTDA